MSINREFRLGMELFQYKLAYVDDLNSTLANVCNNSLLEGSEFARLNVETSNTNIENMLFLFVEVNIVEIISMIILHR